MTPHPPACAKGRTRILIADDDKVMRGFVSRLISKETGLEVVGEAVNGQDAVALARALRPDIVLMDITMPLMNGIEATSLITAEWPGMMVVGLSSLTEDHIKDQMLNAGAIDLLDKSESACILVPSLNRLWAERD